MRRNLFGALLCAVLVSTLVAFAPGTAGATPVMHKPGVPTDISVISADTALIVSWQAPLNTGTSPIQGYVTRVHAFRTNPPCVSTGPTSCVLSGIPNGRAAVVRVHAVNASGAGKSTFITGIPGTTQNCSYVGVYANLQGCNFAYESLPSDNLTDANLTGANLTDVNLSGENLTGAQLAGANLQDISSGGIIGTPASLPTGWAVGGGYLFGPGVGFAWGDLSGVTFPAADLAGANFQGTNLTGSTLSAATSFASADFEYADLADADIQGAQLAGADLADVGSGGVTGTPASLPTGWGVAGGYLVGPEADLSWGTDLQGVTFPVADLTDANLQGADVSGAELSSVTSLEGAGLQYTNLSGSDLTGVDLTNADLTGADLTGANLTGADFTGATVTNVTWSNTTCPDGSNSDTDGGTCVGFGI
jgi:uncharacterized protein YjbI with pentapeptide repeats